MEKENLLIKSMMRPKITSVIIKLRSSGLSNIPQTRKENHPLNGFPAMSRTQMVGIHKARELSGELLRSIARSQRTKIIQIISAKTGGILQDKTQGARLKVTATEKKTDIYFFIWQKISSIIFEVKRISR